MSTANGDRSSTPTHPDWWFADEETFMRNMTICEEERRHDRHFGGPWRGGFRWFKAENIVCLEKVRAKRKRQDTNNGTAA